MCVRETTDYLNLGNDLEIGQFEDYRYLRDYLHNTGTDDRGIDKLTVQAKRSTDQFTIWGENMENNRKTKI